MYNVTRERIRQIIQKEIKYAKNLRAGCQLTNLGVSLALLGLVIPIFTRKNTKKKHEQAIKLAQQNAQQQLKNDETEITSSKSQGKILVPNTGVERNQ